MHAHMRGPVTPQGHCTVITGALHDTQTNRCKGSSSLTPGYSHMCSDVWLVAARGVCQYMHMGMLARL
jgi:hypothetical protein